ncbi:MAG TPA: BrnT family toxin [Candidatus Binataceae bacterium]|nr:BrnT family toxin [Candidatus Binataceae bacterium]
MAEVLLFAWDEVKSERNLRERGFGFDYAAQIFASEVLEEDDRRRDYGEARTVATGEFGGDIFVVVYTWRANRRRIISARRANRRERDAYRTAIAE